MGGHVNSKSYPPAVSILTWCGNLELLYGTLLTFKTLRVGFPLAEVIVIDNASHPDARPQIEAAAKDVGAIFHQLREQIHFAEYYRWALLRQTRFNSLVMADPDLVFWDNCESWDFGDALMAGRYSPEFVVQNPRANVMPRLHTSHLWIPDIDRLRERINADSGGYFEYDPFYPRALRLNGASLLWDTLGLLYAAIEGECYSFGEAELDCYDHLFFGSHIDKVEPRLAMDSPLMMDACRRAHRAAASGNLADIRGIWRQQIQAIPETIPAEQLNSSDAKAREDRVTVAAFVGPTPRAKP